MNEVSAPTAPIGRRNASIKLFVYAAFVLCVAELIGSFTFNIGPGRVVLLPMIWALLIGACLGLLGQRYPYTAALDRDTQLLAAAALQPALLLYIAKLGLLVGGSLPELAKSGWPLAVQEIGHFAGTILLGLPLALLLGIKREAIGATFSVGRESSLAIIGDKFGMDSPEGRGVLAEYVTGTIFGAVFIAIFAGFVTSLHIFSAHALAMGAGIGSGSMMAAASGAIAAQQTADVAKSVFVVAAASNLITTTAGTYFTLFISLPLALWAYKVLEPRLGRFSPAQREDEIAPLAQQDSALCEAPLSYAITFVTWLATALLAVVCGRISNHTPVAEMLPGALLMVGVVAIGDLLYRITSKKIPSICWVSIVAIFAASPAFRCGPWFSTITGKDDFLSITTPILAFAGLSIAKDIPAFRKLGWRIVLVSFAANAGTFLFATALSNLFHP